jgi:hypothetical protein
MVRINKKANKDIFDKKYKLKVELSEPELLSVLASLSKNSHDAEVKLNDEKTALWLLRIRDNLKVQATKQGMNHPVFMK